MNLSIAIYGALQISHMDQIDKIQEYKIIIDGHKKLQLYLNSTHDHQYQIREIVFKNINFNLDLSQKVINKFQTVYGDTNKKRIKTIRFENCEFDALYIFRQDMYRKTEKRNQTCFGKIFLPAHASISNLDFGNRTNFQNDMKESTKLLFDLNLLNQQTCFLSQNNINQVEDKISLEENRDLLLTILNQFNKVCESQDIDNDTKIYCKNIVLAINGQLECLKTSQRTKLPNKDQKRGKVMLVSRMEDSISFPKPTFHKSQYLESEILNKTKPKKISNTTENQEQKKKIENRQESSKNQKSEGLSGGAIAGIIVSGLVLLGGSGVALYFFVFKNKV